MYFPTIESLQNRAEQRGFRQPKKGETEADYRELFAIYMRPIDIVESAEIRSSKGWDKQEPNEMLSNCGIDIEALMRELG